MFLSGGIMWERGDPFPRGFDLLAACVWNLPADLGIYFPFLYNPSTYGLAALFSRRTAG
jgi:hypothetical protein